MGDANTTQTSGQNTGNSALNSFDPSAYGSVWKAGNNNLFGSQVGGGPSNSTDFMKAYQSSLGGLYDIAQQRFNVPQLAQNATNLNNAVLQAPQNSLDMMRGFNADQNQVNAQTNLTLGRLSPLAAAATNQSQMAQQLAQNYINTNIAPTQQYGQMLSDAMARQSTGFTTANEQTLNALTTKMQSGIQLSQSELQLAGQLASAKAQYDATIQSAQIGAQNALQKQQLANQYQNIPAGNTLLNTFTNSLYKAR